MAYVNLIGAVVPRAINTNGKPESGALLYVYEAGTTTPVTTYTDSGAGTANAHPVVADSAGAFGPVYVSDIPLKVTIKTSAGVTLPGYPVDDILLNSAAGNYVRLSVAASLSDADTQAVAAGVDIAVDEVHAVAANITVASRLVFWGGGQLVPATGVAVTLAKGIEAPPRQHVFDVSASGSSCVLSVSQDVYIDWWDRTSADSIQNALDSTAQGSHIWGMGRYTTNGITIDTDEANETGDIGKSLGGIAARGLRLNDTTDEQGFEIKLVDGAATHVIDFDGTAQTGSEGSRVSFTLHDVRINGNRANQTAAKTVSGITAANPPVVTATAHGYSNGDLVFLSGMDEMTEVNNRAYTVANATTDTFELSGVNASSYAAEVTGGSARKVNGYHGVRFDYVKDVTLARVYIENCNGDGINGSNGSCNRIMFHDVEVYYSDRDGANTGAIGDSGGTSLHCATSGRYGWSMSAGSWSIGEYRAYLNGYSGFFGSATADGARQIGRLYSNTNGGNGVRISGKFYQIGECHVDNNGTFTGRTVDFRTGLILSSTSSDNTIGSFYSRTTSAQQHAIYCTSTGTGNDIGRFMHDGDDAVSPIVVSAAARDSIRIGIHKTRDDATTTGNVELLPEDGDLILTGTLTGAVDLDYTTATKVPNGHRQKVRYDDGGGQNITAGTNVVAIATLPTPATNAKFGWLVIEYYEGVAYVIEAYEEP